MKAKGREPLRLSGMPTTAASAMEGCEVMACSMAPACVRKDGQLQGFHVPVENRCAATLITSSALDMIEM
jgi:hypothetical protein